MKIEDRRGRHDDEGDYKKIGHQDNENEEMKDMEMEETNQTDWVTSKQKSIEM